ncbi:hypothetical protein P9112_004849 [Eukaryota sp. TZLM1-RC]
MSLFIGRLTHDIREADVREAFDKFGEITRCDLRGSFGFVTFKEDSQAEKCIDEYHERPLMPGGSRIAVEWAKSSPRYNGSSGPARRSSGGPRGGCYKCGSTSHYVRDCPEERFARDRRRSPSPPYRRSRYEDRYDDRRPRYDDRRSRYEDRYDDRRPRFDDREYRDRSPVRGPSPRRWSPDRDDRRRADTGHRSPPRGRSPPPRSPPLRRESPRFEDRPQSPAWGSGQQDYGLKRGSGIDNQPEEKRPRED